MPHQQEAFQKPVQPPQGNHNLEEEDYYPRVLPGIDTDECFSLQSFQMIPRYTASFLLHQTMTPSGIERLLPFNLVLD